MLDKNQQEIVDSNEPRIIVEAGAGSGKTRVLIERVKRLLKDGVEPSNMVCITFTNMAAEEMKERLVDVPGIGDCFIGTIHSFANKIFKNSNIEYKLFNEEIQDQFMSVLIALYGKFLTMPVYIKYKEYAKKVDMGLMEEEDIERFIDPNALYEIKVFLKNYRDKNYPENMNILCKRHNVITFDELLERTTKYFKEIDGKVEYLFVDEFQDIGPLEKKFFQALNADNYFYVGDEKQALYAFKGGNVNFFLNLIKSPKWKTYYLKNNYRCGQAILELATRVIVQADDVISYESICKSGKVGNTIVDSKYKIDNYLKSITNYKDWFVLVRTNKDLVKLEAKMREFEIPYVSFRKGEMTLDQMRNCMAEDKVKLLTIHTSKGLESPNVLLWGNFPIRQKPYLRNNDELKVLYVGITRGIDQTIVLN
jgi:DNA helicase II / ATP-dependent DNA helicase PcrA